MDDFSFPAIAVDPDSLCQLPFPHFASSPLWFLSSVSEAKAARTRRSFSSAEDAYGGKNANEDLGPVRGRHLSSPALSDDDNGGRFLENEKMDLLWEDFNEELARLSYHKRQASQESRGDAASRLAFSAPGVGSKSRKGNRGAKVDLRGPQARGMTKSTSAIQHRTPSLVVMLKLLKRLFLIQNPRSSRKTRHCDEQDARES